MLPVKYRQSVIKMAHDNGAGHMGVRKTYDRVLRLFLASSEAEDSGLH